MNIRFENIPMELEKYPNWVCWTYAMRGGKQTKIPIDPKTSQLAKSNEPKTWAGYGYTKDFFQKCRWVDGMGFMLLGTPFFVIDLDHCYRGDELSYTAQNVLDLLGPSFCEVTPSGYGLHLWGIGFLPDICPRRRRSGIEIYTPDSPRFISVTGNICEFSQREIPWAVSGLHRVYKQFFPETIGILVRDNPPSPTMDDEEILFRVARSANGAKFAALLCGDISAYGNDHSVADAAFIGLLAFWTQDRDQLDRLLRRSKLMRPKWDASRGLSTYGFRTIDAVLGRLNERYSAPSQDEEVDKIIYTKKEHYEKAS